MVKFIIRYTVIVILLSFRVPNDWDSLCRFSLRFETVPTGSDRIITASGKKGTVAKCHFDPGALTLVQFPDGSKRLIFTGILKKVG